MWIPWFTLDKRRLSRSPPSWLLFTLCELKNAAAFVLKHSLWEPQNLAFAFWENMLPTKKVFVKCLHNIFAWHTIVRKFPPLLTASLLLLLPNWGVEVRFHGNRNRGGQFGDTRTKTGHWKVDMQWYVQCGLKIQIYPKFRKTNLYKKTLEQFCQYKEFSVSVKHIAQYFIFKSKSQLDQNVEIESHRVRVFVWWQLPVPAKEVERQRDNVDFMQTPSSWGQRGIY